jgi:hypothetical protein
MAPMIDVVGATASMTDMPVVGHTSRRHCA